MLYVINCLINRISMCNQILKGTAEEWRIVFIVTAVFYVIGAIPFLLLVDDKVQHWNDLDSSSNETSDVVDQDTNNLDVNEMKKVVGSSN